MTPTIEQLEAFGYVAVWINGKRSWKPPQREYQREPTEIGAWIEVSDCQRQHS